MKNDDLINEGEAIQEGLERFLQEELAGMAREHSKQPDKTEITPVEKALERTGNKTVDISLERIGNKTVDIPLERTGNKTVDIPLERTGNKTVDIPLERTGNKTVDIPLERTGNKTMDIPLERTGNKTVDIPLERTRDKTVDIIGERFHSGASKETPVIPVGGKSRSNSSKRDGRKNNTKGKKMSKKKKSKLRGFLTFLFILILLLAGGMYLLVGSIYNKMDYERAEELVSEPMKEDGVTNILLIGNDSRSQGEDGRSDAMILLSISNKTKKIHMTSLLRDMYVDIPGREGNRLNAAYAYGGPTLLLQTIEQNLGITVNRYVLVNFQAFANLVDAVGGVDLELSNEEVKWVNAYLNEYNLLEGRDITTDYLDESLSGMIHLNGPQALAYCRNRYIGTDFERTNRQRKVIAAVAGKLPVALAANSGELVEGLFPQLTTNLTQSECYSLSLQASKFLTYEIVQSSIPIEGSYKNATIRQMSVLEVDYEKNKEYITQNIYGEE